MPVKLSSLNFKQTFRRQTICRNLLGAKFANVTVSLRNAVSVELLKQRDNDPSTAAEFLPKLTDRGSSLVPNE
jgi:hypothetical protein